MDSNSKLIIEIYLKSVADLLRTLHPEPFSSAEVSLIRLFLLGVTDFVRQANKLKNQEFFELYSLALDNFNISRPDSTAELIDFLHEQIKASKTLSEIVRIGAGSVFSYTANNDDNSAFDLLKLLQASKED